eukprot:gene247-biopygen1535
MGGSETSGAEWSRFEWSGAERSGVKWSGVEWSGVECSGVEWTGSACGTAFCFMVVFSSEYSEFKALPSHPWPAPKMPIHSQDSGFRFCLYRQKRLKSPVRCYNRLKSKATPPGRAGSQIQQGKPDCLHVFAMSADAGEQVTCAANCGSSWECLAVVPPKQFLFSCYFAQETAVPRVLCCTCTSMLRLEKECADAYKVGETNHAPGKERREYRVNAIVAAMCGSLSHPLRRLLANRPRSCTSNFAVSIMRIACGDPKVSSFFGKGPDLPIPCFGARRTTLPPGNMRHECGRQSAAKDVRARRSVMRLPGSNGSGCVPEVSHMMEYEVPDASSVVSPNRGSGTAVDPPRRSSGGKAGLQKK